MYHHEMVQDVAGVTHPEVENNYLFSNSATITPGYGSKLSSPIHNPGSIMGPLVAATPWSPKTMSLLHRFKRPLLFVVADILTLSVDPHGRTKETPFSYPHPALHLVLVM